MLTLASFARNLNFGGVWYRNFWYSPKVVRRVVKVLVKSLYMMDVRAIGW